MGVTACERKAVWVGIASHGNLHVHPANGHDFRVESGHHDCDVSQGTELRATFFKEAVDKFYELIQEVVVQSCCCPSFRLLLHPVRFSGFRTQYSPVTMPAGWRRC